MNKMAAEVAKSPQAQQLKDRITDLAKKPLHENPNVDKAIKGTPVLIHINKSSTWKSGKHIRAMPRTIRIAMRTMIRQRLFCLQNKLNQVT